MKQVPFGPVRFDILQLKRKDRATINSIEELQEELDNTLTSVSGNPITLSDSSNTNAEGLTATISLSQAGTGDPSPDNVRNISGVSTLKVYRTGINICEETWETGYLDGSTGAETSESTSIRSVNFNPCSPSTTYYGFDASTASGTYIYWYDESKTYISRISIYRGVAVTSPANARFFKVTAYHGGATYGNNISINYPATDRTYHQYQGSTVSLSLGSTVYGGSVNLTTGVLTEDRKMYEFDGSDDESWTAGGSNDNGIYNFYIDHAGDLSVDAGISNRLELQTTILSETTREGFFINENRIFLRLSSSRATTVAELKTWLASNNVQICGVLSTPTTTQLTATNLRLLQGNNTIWSNGDTLSFSYQPNNLIGELKAWVLDQLS